MALGANLTQLNTSDLTFTCTPGVTLNLPGFTWTLGANLAMNDAANVITLNVNNGTLTDGASTFSVTISDATLTAAGTSSVTVGDLIVNNAGAVVTLGGTGTFSFGAINETAGSVVLGNAVVGCATVSVTGGDIDLGGSSLTASGAPNVINTGGVITAGTSTLTFNGAGTLTLDGNEAVNSVFIGAATTLLSAGAATDAVVLTVTGSLAAGANNLTLSGSVGLSGDYTATSGTLTSGTTVTLNGAADISSNAGGDLFVGTDLLYAAGSSGGIDFSVGGGAVTVTGNLTQNATATGGLSVNGGDVTVGGALTWRGTMTLAGTSALDVNGVVASSNAGTISTTGSGAQQYSGGFTNTGTMNGGGGLMEFLSTLTSTAGSVNVGSGGLTVVSTANFTGSALNGNVGANPDLTFQGDVTFGGGFTHNSDRVVFSGAVAQNVDTSGRPFANIRVDKTANGITLINNNMTQAVALGSLDINDGTVDLGGRTWTLGANLVMGSANSPVLQVNNGTLTDGANTFSVTVGQLATLTAAGTSSVTVGDLIVNNAGAVVTLGGTGTFSWAINETAGSVVLGNAVVGCATVSVTGGDIDLGGSSLTASGAPNVINTGGVITAGTSTLTFNGAGSLTLDGNEAVNSVFIGAATTLLSAGAATDAVVLTVTGSLAAGANNLTLSGSVGLSGDYTATSGTLTSGTTVTLNGAADISSNAGGDLFVGTDLLYAAGSSGGIDFSVGGGAVTVTGNLTQNATATGGLSVNGGDVTVGGALTWRGTMTLAGTSALDVNGVVASSNAGTISTTGSGAQQYSGGFTNTGTMNGGGGLMEFLSTLTSTAGSVNVGSGGLTVVSTANFTGSALNGNVGANPDLTFQGDVTFGGGFTHNSDRVVFSGAVAQNVDTSGRPFANIRVDKTANGITLINNNMTQAVALGSLDINDGTVDLGGRTWTLGANLVMGSANSPVLQVNNGTLTDGANTFSVTVGQLATLTAAGTSSVTVGDLIVNNAGAVVTLGGTGTFSFGAINETAGSVVLGNAVVGCATVSVTGGDIDLGGSSLTASGAPNVINTGGVITAGTSTLTFNGAGTLTLDGNEAVNSVFIGAATTLLSAGAATDAVVLTVTGSLAAGANNLTLSGSVGLSGDYTATSGTLTSGTTVTLNGAADISSNAGGDLFVGTDLLYAAGSSGGIDFSVGGGAVTVTGNLTQNATATGGLSVNGGDVTVGGALTWRGTMTLAGTSALDVNGVVASSNAGTISTTGSGAQQYSGGFTNTGTMNGGGGLMEFLSTLTSTAGSVNVGSGGLTVVSTANFTGSALNGNVGANPDLTFQGDVTFGGGFTHNSDRVVFSGAVAQNVDTSGRPFANIQVNKIGSSVTLMDAMQVNGNLNIVAGVLDIGGNDLTVSGVFTNNGELWRNGSGESATKCNTSGIVVYKLTVGGIIETYGGGLADKDYYHLRIDSGNFSLSMNLYVLHDLEIAGGSLTAGNHIIYLEGTFDTSLGGTFNYGTSELVFDNSSGSYGTSFIYGSNTFYRFTCNWPSKVIRFQANSMQTIAAGRRFHY